MRIARFLSDDSAQPCIALERDGCLFDVVALEQAFDVEVKTEAPSDFRTRAAILRGAGLVDLDARLLRGQRPAAAVRGGPRTLVLAPCDTERAYLVRVDRGARGLTAWLGDARAMLGPGAFVTVPAQAEGAAIVPALGVMIADELANATVADAARAIVGYTIVHDWTWVDAAGAVVTSVPRTVSAQAGPVLASAYELGALERLEVRIRVAGELVATGAIATSTVALAEAVAFASRSFQLRPGDVVAVGPLVDAPQIVARAHQRVRIEVDRLGDLEGTPVPATTASAG